MIFRDWDVIVSVVTAIVLNLPKSMRDIIKESPFINALCAQDTEAAVVGSTARPLSRASLSKYLFFHSGPFTPVDCAHPLIDRT